MWHRVVESSSSPTFRNFIAPSSSKSSKAPWPEYEGITMFETSRVVCQLIRRHTPKDLNLQQRVYKNLKSLINIYVSNPLFITLGRTDRAQLSRFMHWLVSEAPEATKQFILTLYTFHVIFYLPTFNAQYFQADRFVTWTSKLFDLFHAIFSEFLTILLVTHQNDTSTNWFLDHNKKKGSRTPWRRRRKCRKRSHN
jgi:hypothetical protein